MCRELDALQQSMLAYAGGFDARSLTPAQAGEVARACARIEASAASVKVLASARGAEGDGWRHEGYRSAADRLARESGMSPTSARRALETGRRMADQPEVARAALAGELSAEQAEAVSDGAAADPTRALELIDKARSASLPELNEEVARAKAAVTDQEARRRDRHARRSFKRWTDRDGALQAHLYGQPEDGARLWQVLDPIRRHLVVRRRGSTPNEPLDALDYDAITILAAVAAGRDAELGIADLLELGLFPQLDADVLGARTGPTAVGEDGDTGGPAPAKALRRQLALSPSRLMIRVDYDVLLRGIPITGDVCEIAGCPVPLSVIEDVLAGDNPFLIGILTKGRDVLRVHHFGHRYPSAHQKSALDWLYPTCAAAGCSARAGLQSDHREDWSRTRFTLLDLLDRLCPHHHRLKTQHGWALVPGKGKRVFVGPHDPRHPRHLAAAASTGQHTVPAEGRPP